MPQQRGHAAKSFIKGVVGWGLGAEMTRRWIHQYSRHTKAIRKDKGHHTIKRLIQEENITHINIYVPNIEVPKCIKQILTNPKGETDGNIIITEDLNTLLTSMDRSFRQKTSKATEILHDTIGQLDLVDIFRYYIQKLRIHILFKHTWNIFYGRPHTGTQNKPQQI